MSQFLNTAGKGRYTDVRLLNFFFLYSTIIMKSGLVRYLILYLVAKLTEADKTSKLHFGGGCFNSLLVNHLAQGFS
jgi:hypothetical protein